MKHADSAIAINVDVTNPGQFFACCGLLELADRLWPGAEGWFHTNDKTFFMRAPGTLDELVNAIVSAKMSAKRPDDGRSTPIVIADPFRCLCVDWWETDLTGANNLKVWSGLMESFGIAQALQHAMSDNRDCFCGSDLFNVGMVVTKRNNSQRKVESYYFDAPRAGRRARRVGGAQRKVEPYYLDARRSCNAHSRDVGFSPNDLKMTTVAHPAVELLCLIGLQVARPVQKGGEHDFSEYEYSTWHFPLPSSLLLAASTGCMRTLGMRTYRFANWFRTGKKERYKAFRFATLVSEGGLSNVRGTV